MSRISIFVVLLATHLLSNKFACASTGPDSLQNSMQNSSDEERIETLIQLAADEIATNPAKALELYHEALKQATSERHKQFQMQILMALGHYYTFTDYNAELAKDHTRRAFRLSERIGDSASMALLYIRFGVVYGRNSEFDSALYFLNTGRPVIERHADARGRSRAYNAIGNIYLKGFSDYRKALEFYIKALDENTLAGDRHGIATNCCNIANAYDELGEPEKALIYATTGLNAAKETGDTNLIYSLYISQAVVHCGLQQYNQALRSYRLAKQYIDISDSLKRGIVYNNMAIIYINTDEFDSAYHLLTQARTLSERTGNLELISSIEFNLHQYYALRNLPYKALEHLRTYIIIRDSLNQQISTQALNEQLAKFETQQRQMQIEAENALKSEQIRLLRGQILFVLFAGLVIIAILVWAFMMKTAHIRELNEQKRQIQRTGEAINTINSIGKKLTGNLNPLLMMDDLYKSIQKLVSADVFAVGQYNRNTHTLDFFDSRESDMKLPFYSMHVQNDSGFETYCFTNNELLLINDTELAWGEFFPNQPVRYYKLFKHAGSMICIPINIENNTIGVLTVYSYSKNAYDNHHASYLQNLAHFIAIALENANNYILILEVRNKLAASLDELKASEAMLKRSNESKDRLFSVIAHDLKNPFNTIMGYVDLLCEEYMNLSDVQRIEYLENVRQASLMSFKLLQNLLEWSQAQAGLQEFKPHDFLVNPVVGEIISLFQVWANHKKVVVRNLVEEDVSITADINMTKTVFRNLIANAIKYSYEGGFVEIGYRRVNGTIEFYVQDNGVGMTDGQIGKLFNTGEQNHTPGTASETGSGLGLFLCYDFVKHHQGSIWVKSAPGRGSVFYFTLSPSRSSESKT